MVHYSLVLLISLSFVTAAPIPFSSSDLFGVRHAHHARSLADVESRSHLAGRAVTVALTTPAVTTTDPTPKKASSGSVSKLLATFKKHVGKVLKLKPKGSSPTGTSSESAPSDLSKSKIGKKISFEASEQRPAAGSADLPRLDLRPALGVTTPPKYDASASPKSKSKGATTAAAKPSLGDAQPKRTSYDLYVTGSSNSIPPQDRAAPSSTKSFISTSNPRRTALKSKEAQRAARAAKDAVPNKSQRRPLVTWSDNDSTLLPLTKTVEYKPTEPINVLATPENLRNNPAVKQTKLLQSVNNGLEKSLAHVFVV